MVKGSRVADATKLEFTDKRKSSHIKSLANENYDRKNFLFSIYYIYKYYENRESNVK